MSDGLLGMLLLVVVIALVVGFIYKVIQWVEKRKVAYFEQLAAAYEGLTCEKDLAGKYGTAKGPVVLGTIQNKTFCAYTYTTGGGKNIEHWTAFEITHGLTLNGYALKLVHEHFFRKMGKRLGAVKEIELGVQDFDKRFLIQTENTATTRALLPKNVRDKALAIPNLYFGELVINNSSIVYKLPYQITTDHVYKHFTAGLDIGLLLLEGLERVYRA